MKRTVYASEVSGILIATLALLSAGTARAADLVVDQQYRPKVHWGGAARSSDVWGQTFTAGLSGKLTAVNLTITRPLFVTQDFEAKLCDLAAGTVLAQVRLPAADIPADWDWSSDRLSAVLDFSASEVRLTAGASYVLDFRSDSDWGYGLLFGCDTESCDTGGYASGYAHSNRTPRNEDHNFQTVVETLGSRSSPPVILVHPTDAVAWLGDRVAHRVSVSGSLPFRYQWFKDGVAVANETNSVYVTPQAQLQDAGKLRVRISNSFGSVDSIPGSLAVKDRPQIIWVSQDTFVALGSEASLTVMAAGKGTLSYQWHLAEGPIPGANTPSFRFTPTHAQTSEVWVVVNDSSGTAESSHGRFVVRDDSHLILWKHKLYYPWSSPAVNANGDCFLITYSGVFVSANNRGEIRWNSSVGGGFSSPVLLNDHLIAIADRGMRILSQQDGSSQFSLPGSAHITSAAAYDGIQNSLFYADDDGFFRRADISPPRVAWERRLSEKRFVAPVTYSSSLNLAFVVTPEGELTALDGETGATRWTRTNLVGIYGSPEGVLGDDHLMLLSYATNLFALDARTGIERWRYSNTNYLSASPIIGHGQIFQGTGASMVSLDLTGRVLWESPLNPPPSAEPTLAADGTLMAPCRNLLIALRSSDGSLLWDYLNEDEITHPVSILPGGNIIFTGGSGDPNGDYVVAIKGTAPLADSPWPKSRANLANTGASKPSVSSLQPRWIREPADTATAEGKALDLVAEAGGAPPLFFQWYKGVEVLLGATQPSLHIPSVILASEGDYVLVVSNRFGALMSKPVRTRVLQRPLAWLVTIAGDGAPGHDDHEEARFGHLQTPGSPVIDSLGNIYIPSGNSIRRVTPDGQLETLAGQQLPGFTNGIALHSAFNQPRAVALDIAGNLLVADALNHRLRQVGIPSANTTTFAGSGISGQKNGPALDAELSHPVGLAVSSDSVVYFVETDHHHIRRVRDGVVSLFAGGQDPGLTDGAGAAARFRSPRGLGVDRAGNVYVADTGNHAIRKITTDGLVSTIAGGVGNGLSDGSTSAAQLDSPNAIAVSPDGMIFFADAGNHCIRMVHPLGVVLTLVGNGKSGRRDGTNQLAILNSPSGVAIASDGSLVLSDSGNHLVRRVTFSAPVIKPLNFGQISIEMIPKLTVRGAVGDRFEILLSDQPFGPWMHRTNLTLTETNVVWMDETPNAWRRFYRASRVSQ